MRARRVRVLIGGVLLALVVAGGLAVVKPCPPFRCPCGAVWIGDLFIGCWPCLD